VSPQARLNRLRAIAESPDSSRGSRHQARHQARRLCAETATPTPRWARLQSRSAAATRAWQTRKSSRARQASPPPLAPREKSATLGCVREPGAAAISLPPELTDWRKRGEGRCVRVSRQGVTLYELTDQHWFPSVADALAAIQDQP
jgi:hypothetical protein